MDSRKSKGKPFFQGSLLFNNSINKGEPVMPWPQTIPSCQQDALDGDWRSTPLFHSPSAGLLFPCAGADGQAALLTFAPALTVAAGKPTPSF